MKFIFLLLIALFTNNCSLNKDLDYWTENTIKNKVNENKLRKINEKSDDITTMTFDEYKIYIDQYTKKSKYPDISK